MASDSDLARAAQETGLMADILEMPEGFETRLTDELQQQMPSGNQAAPPVGARLRQRGLDLLDG